MGEGSKSSLGKFAMRVGGAQTKKCRKTIKIIDKFRKTRVKAAEV